MTAPRSVSRAEYHDMVAGTMTEAQLQTGVIRLAKALGWEVYHTHDSRGSQKGFPDLVLWHVEQGRILYRELKTTKGKLTAEQRTVLLALRAAGGDVDVWRPIDYLDDTVLHQLSPPE